MINLKFNLQRLKNTYGLTIISNRHKNTKIGCLLDTGANVPVWCAGEESLKSYYHNCHKQDAVFLLRGFGRGYEIAKVYIIPDFILSDGKEEIHYNNLIVVVVERDFSFNMILSYTMFNKMNISIDTFTNRNGTHNVAPNLRISSVKDTYMVRYKLADLSNFNKQTICQKCGTERILDSIYVFNQ